MGKLGIPDHGEHRHGYGIDERHGEVAVLVDNVDLNFLHILNPIRQQRRGPRERTEEHRPRTIGMGGGVQRLREWQG